MIEAFKYRLPVTYFLKIQGLDLVLSDGSNISGSSLQFCPAMRIKGQAIGHSVSPLSVAGEGRALDITLDADTLQKSGYLDDYFAPPTVVATLNTDEITKTTTSFPLDDASGFASGGGTAYWGLEKLAYGSRTSSGATQTLNSVTRDSTGSAFNYSQASPRGLSGVWSVVSDRPLLWTGRLVELWAVATNPEGELLAAPFDASSITTAEARIWVGYISEQPTISTTGITLRCLPAERLIEKEYGHQRSFKTAWKKNPYHGTWIEPIYWPVNHKITMTLRDQDGTEYSSSVDPVVVKVGSAPAENNAARIMYPAEAWSYARTVWETDLGTAISGTVTITTSKGDPEEVNPDAPLNVTVECSTGDILGFSVSVHNGFNGPSYQTAMVGDPTGDVVLVDPNVYGYASAFPLQLVRSYSPPALTNVQMTGGFPIVDPISSADSVWGGIPTVGQAVSWEQNLGHYDHTFTGKVTAVIETSALAGFDKEYFIRVDPNSAEVYGINQYAANLPSVDELQEALLIEGAADSEGAAALTQSNLWLQLLCSSGSGSKSATYDTLPHGFGAGIPEAWIAFTSSTYADFAAVQKFEAYGDIEAQTVFIDALASQRAFSQTLVDGLAKVDAVEVSQPSEGETLVALTPSDLIAEPVQAGVLDAPPNVLIFEFLNSSLPKVIHRDTLRIASEGGINSLDLSVPRQWYHEGPTDQPSGITRLGAVANSILRGPFFGHVYLFTLSLAADKWEAVNVGDAVEVTGEHYAWVNLAASSSPGHRASSIRGRCLGKEAQLDGSGMSITLAVWPSTAPQVYCPDSTFTVSSLTITLPAGRVGWFWDGEREDVTFYKPGEEASKLETKEMQSSAGNDITFSSLPSWVGESGVLVTFAPTASASDRQKKWAHVSDGGIML